MEKANILERFLAENQKKMERTDLTPRLREYNENVKKVREDYNVKRQKSQISASQLHLNS
jgi:hypothetical protein